MKKIVNVLFIVMLLAAVGCVTKPGTEEASVNSMDAAVMAPLTNDMVRLHYQRMDEDYASWGLHVWGADYGGDAVEWTAPVVATGFDDYGAYWDISYLGGDDLNFIIHNGDEKDPDGDRSFIELESFNEFWAISGDSELYTSLAEVE